MKHWNVAGATVLGMLAAVLALGHFPGWDTEAGAWLPVGSMLFEWVFPAMGAAAGLWQKDAKIVIPKPKGRLPE